MPQPRARARVTKSFRLANRTIAPQTLAFPFSPAPNMEFDLRTVVVAIAASLTVISAGVLVTSKTYPSHVRRSAVRWGLASALQAIGWIMLASRGHIPDVVSIVAANTILSLSVTQFEHAIRDFFRVPAPLVAIYWSPAAVFLLFVYFGAIAPDFTARVVIISAFGAYQLGRCAWVLMRRGGNPTLRAAWLTGMGFLIASATLAARTLFAGSPSSPSRATKLFESTPVEQIAFLVLFMSVFLLSFGFLLMCTESFTRDLVRFATLDPLTELFNRRTIEDLARRELSMSRRKGQPMTLAMLDVDNFKMINDTFGHSAGDDALRQVVASIADLLRAQDLIGRVGGEEFLVVMPSTNTAQALVAAERLRAVVESTGLLLDGKRVSLTVSIGLASFAGGDQDLDALLKNADRALYAAKAAGRNRVSSGLPDEVGNGTAAV